MILGSEAMFADLGHFSVRAIQVSTQIIYLFIYTDQHCL